MKKKKRLGTRQKRCSTVQEDHTSLKGNGDKRIIKKKGGNVLDGNLQFGKERIETGERRPGPSVWEPEQNCEGGGVKVSNVGRNAPGSRLPTKVWRQGELGVWRGHHS